MRKRKRDLRCARAVMASSSERERGKASSLFQTRKDSHTIEGVFSEPQIFVSSTSSCKKKRGKIRKAATNIV